MENYSAISSSGFFRNLKFEFEFKDELESEKKAHRGRGLALDPSIPRSSNSLAYRVPSVCPFIRTGSPAPSPPSKCVLPPPSGTKGGGQHSLGGEGQEEPIRTTGHYKKSLSIFPSLGGMSLTKFSLAGKNLTVPGKGEFGQ